jgi:glycosyltransferase involved in cell wall biosynthesis
MTEQKKILLIDFCNFEDYPIGGHLSFAKNLMLAFKNDLALIGITTNEKDPLGQWFKKDINGVLHDFFALARYKKSKTKHLLPDRLVSYILTNYYKKGILSCNIKNVFIQRHDILLATKDFGFKNVCYRFGGLENPLEFSKYWYAKYIAAFFDKKFFSSFTGVKLILASGDKNSIKQMTISSKGHINSESVYMFPTRIDDQIFMPLNKSEARKILNIPESDLIVSTTGRLSSIKGWRFMIDCYIEFEKRNSGSSFYFIGEGEDYSEINDYIFSKGLQSKIKLMGKKNQEEVALFLNASDLYIMGSYKEGWSTTLVEALACGVPICTTNFSSAKEIVSDGITGYVVEDHNIEVFSNKMEDSFKLNRAQLPISSQIKRYAVSELRTELLNLWDLL